MVMLMFVFFQLLFFCQYGIDDYGVISVLFYCERFYPGGHLYDMNSDVWRQSTHPFNELPDELNVFFSDLP